MVKASVAAVAAAVVGAAILVRAVLAAIVAPRRVAWDKGVVDAVGEGVKPQRSSLDAMSIRSRLPRRF